MVTDPNPPIECPRRLKQPCGRRLELHRRKRQLVVDAQHRVRPLLDFDRISQPVEDRQQVARADVARSQPGRRRHDPRNAPTGGGDVGKRCLQLARERVGRRGGFVGPLHDCDCTRTHERLGQLAGGEGTEAGYRDRASAHTGRPAGNRRRRRQCRRWCPWRPTRSRRRLSGSARSTRVGGWSSRAHSSSAAVSAAGIRSYQARWAILPFM